MWVWSCYASAQNDPETMVDRFDVTEVVVTSRVTFVVREEPSSVGGVTGVLSQNAREASSP